jgi:1-deoxy-D-xylulose-5-phosphate synthase
MLDDAARHGIVVTCEDGVVDGGVGERITTALAALHRQPFPTVARLGLPNRFLPHARRDDLLARYGLNVAGIADQVVAMLGTTGRSRRWHHGPEHRLS